MNKTRKLAITGAAIASAAALAIGGSVAASADDGDGKQHGRDGKGGGALTSLVEDGTLTKSDVTAIREAMQAAHGGDKEARQAERAAAKAAILADLVTDGTLTQAQADAIASATKGGMRELIANGTIDRDDVQALKAAMDEFRQDNQADREAKQAERAAERDAILEGLVADGTLTQSQADAVESAIAAKQAQQGERGKGKQGKQSKWGNKGEGKRGMNGARA